MPPRTSWALARSEGVFFTPELAVPLLRATAALRARVGGAAEPFDGLIAELKANRAALEAGTFVATAGVAEGKAGEAGTGTDTAPAGTGTDYRASRNRDRRRAPARNRDRHPAPAGASTGCRPGPPGRPQDAGRRSVRVPAEKIDHLLDLVGEVMQDRRRLAHALGSG